MTYLESRPVDAKSAGPCQQGVCVCASVPSRSGPIHHWKMGSNRASAMALGGKRPFLSTLLLATVQITVQVPRLGQERPGEEGVSHPGFALVGVTPE